MTYKTCLYTTIKNESRIIEFVNYYIKIGIDYFIFLDDNSTENVKTVLLKNNIDRNIFTVLYVGGRNFFEVYCTATHWKNEILPILNEKRVDYLLYLDADEFLCLNNFKNINETIHFYSPFDSLKINWLIFGSCKMRENKSKSIIYTFNKSDDHLSPYVKCLTRVSAIDTTGIVGNNPHVLNVRNNGITKNVLNTIVGKNENRLIEPVGIHYKSSPVYIAHYLLQDVFTYIDRKMTSFVFNIVAQNYRLTSENIDLIKNNRHVIASFLLETKPDIVSSQLDNLQRLLKMQRNNINFYNWHFNHMDKNCNKIVNHDIIDFNTYSHLRK